MYVRTVNSFSGFNLENQVVWSSADLRQICFTGTRVILSELENAYNTKLIPDQQFVEEKQRSPAVCL